MQHVLGKLDLLSPASFVFSNIGGELQQSSSTIPVVMEKYPQRFQVKFQ